MIGGAIIGATALLIVGVGLPAVHRWAVREADYAARRDQWTRLQALVANADRLRDALTARRLAFAADGERLVSGSTPALAASTLQGLLQRYADESAVQFDRVDVAADPRPAGSGLLEIPVQLQARGDVYGLVDFLYRVERGDKLVVVDELTLNGGTDEGGDGTETRGPQTLSWTLAVHGLYGGANP
ncbi:MAG TPA: type II secretion system protein GspM [Gemmatimonadales bacterium]|nr:type II secretion system protein GspM [Gemmatimonadales bacterium]